jgi:hypothetical protein
MNRWKGEDGVPQTNEWHGFLFEMFSEALDCNEAMEMKRQCSVKRAEKGFFVRNDFIGF